MSNFKKPLPEWNAEGIEPPQSKKNEGWKEGDKPPAPWHNWWMNTSYEALKEMREFLDTLEIVTDWKDIENKPETFPPSSHKHAISDVTNLQTELDGKETPAGAQEKANQALSDAKAYTDQSLEMGKYKWQYNESTDSLDLVVIE